LEIYKFSLYYILSFSSLPFLRVFYIGSLSCAPLLIATLSFYSSSVLPNASSFCSAIRLVAVSVHSKVPYRAGPLQNSTLTCAAASPLPPDSNSPSLSITWQSASRIYGRGVAPGERIGDTAGGFFTGSATYIFNGLAAATSGGAPSRIPPIPSSNSTASPSQEELQFDESVTPGVREEAARKDLLLPRASGHRLLRGGAPPGGKKLAAAGREESASSWRRPGGREEASRGEGGIHKQWRRPDPEALLALKFLTAATVSSRQGA
jgi:hypothetical protein